MKNHTDVLILSQSEQNSLWLFVSERKQIALMADVKLHTQVSHRLFATSRSEMRYIMEFMNLGTIVVLGVVVCIVCLIVRSIYKDKKSGKSQCGGDCSRCKGCH